MTDIQIDLSRCELDELLSLIGGDMDGKTSARFLRKVVVNVKALNGAQLGEAMTAVTTKVKEAINPKSEA